MNKIIRLGSAKDEVSGRQYSIYCNIEIKDGRLSICGVEGPLKNGNAIGACGQIYDNIDPLKITPSPGWKATDISQFKQIWQQWHLNDMRAECEHQRTLGWEYSTHQGQKCPTCGYEIGTAWLKEELPQHVIDFLESLPETDKEPAWV